MFLIKKLILDQSVHFWSYDTSITKHGIYKIDYISAIFIDKDLWFGPKYFSKIICRTFHHVWGHQVHFWSHGLAPTFFSEESANNFATVSSRLPQQADSLTGL